MSRLEIIILICVCVLPIVALLLILPKKLKKSPPPPTKPYVEEKPAEPQQPVQPTPPPQPVPKPITKEEDFKDYLSNRPPRLNQPPTFPPTPRFMFDEDMPMRQNTQPQPDDNKSLAEEVQNLSPELKALLLSGALDKKYDYDNLDQDDDKGKK